MTAWIWGSQWVTRLYEALRDQGSLGCVVAVMAAWQIASWGRRLAEGRRRYQAFERRARWLDAVARARSGRAIGALLQFGGAALVALAMVALARNLAEG